MKRNAKRSCSLLLEGECGLFFGGSSNNRQRLRNDERRTVYGRSVRVVQNSVGWGRHGTRAAKNIHWSAKFSRHADSFLVGLSQVETVPLRLIFSLLSTRISYILFPDSNLLDRIRDRIISQKHPVI